MVRPLRSEVNDPPQNPRRTVWSGDLIALARMLDKTTFVVAANSAIVHLAAAAGVPVVGLYNNHVTAAEWYPVGADYRIMMPGTDSSIREIKADDVFECFVEPKTSQRGTHYGPQ